MSSSPPRKKLKQPNILEGFQRQNNKSSVEMQNNEKPSTSINEETGHSSGSCETVKIEDSDPESDDGIWERNPLPNDKPTITEKDCPQGTPINELFTTPLCCAKLPELVRSEDHTVTIKLPYKYSEVDCPAPYPEEYQDKWDDVHVKMPCSPQNLYPVPSKDQGSKKKTLAKRWELIQKTLSRQMDIPEFIEEGILEYNSRYRNKWDFAGLNIFFNKVFEPEETKAFFSDILPKIKDLALALPKILTQPVPLLRKQQQHTVTLSQKQIASLLANAFFCTFPRRNARFRNAEYSNYPTINFNTLFQSVGKGKDISPRTAEKLKCLLHYFKRITQKMPTGNVTFERRVIKQFPKWEKSNAELTRLHVSASGTIEDDGRGMLQVDFANKFLGGGVLTHGLVQEEIRFLICPELMVSKLITECLDYNESLTITGCEQFSHYSGYRDTFKWEKDCQDQTPRDSWGRRQTEIVAIDAIRFHSHLEQFKNYCLQRELNKAYSGFIVTGNVEKENIPAVATGNWGCGAFGGDIRLKSLIQLMAAAEAKRDVCYFTFGDIKFKEELFTMHQFLKQKNLAVSDLYALIQQYYQGVCKTSKKEFPTVNLFQHIYTNYGMADCETDTSNEMGEDIQDEASKQSESPDYKVDTP